MCVSDEQMGWAVPSNKEGGYIVPTCLSVAAVIHARALTTQDNATRSPRKSKRMKDECTTAQSHATRCQKMAREHRSANRTEYEIEGRLRRCYLLNPRVPFLRTHTRDSRRVGERRVSDHAVRVVDNRDAKNGLFTAREMQQRKRSTVSSVFFSSLAL